MKKLVFVSLLLVSFLAFFSVSAQTRADKPATPLVDVYYFHPNERCPIDQAIEENTIKLVRTDFAKEVASGLLKLTIVNTDVPGNAELASKFEINTQALYIVRHDTEDKKTDLTEFAFANGKNNPTKFMDRLKEEIINAMK
jgi:hypothetical protein